MSRIFVRVCCVYCINTSVPQKNNSSIGENRKRSVSLRLQTLKSFINTFQNNYSDFGTIRKLSNAIITFTSVSGFPNTITEKLTALAKSSFKSSFGWSWL